MDQNTNAHLSPRTIANRLNAQKSTGPKTSEGKRRSSQNAITHGLTAANNVETIFDNPGEFQAFQQGLLDHFLPQTPYQAALVDRIINLMWRLRRVPIIEAQIMKGKLDGWKSPHPSMAYVKGDGALEFLHLSRYEANLDRCLHRTLKDLEDARHPKYESPIANRESRPLTQSERPTPNAERLSHTNPQNEPNWQSHSLFNSDKRGPSNRDLHS